MLLAAARTRQPERRSKRTPTRQLAGDFMLIDVSLRQAERDGKCGVIDFRIVTPAAESYCLCSGSKTTTTCCQNQKWRRIWSSKSPRNIQEDLQSYNPINGSKWIFYILYSILLEIKTSCHTTCKDYAFQCTQMGNGT